MAEDMNENRVGKGNPPKAHRFRKGQSGNRKGRPKNRQNLKTIVHRVAHKEHEVKANGGRLTLPTVGLILRKLEERALQGSVEAVKYLGQLREKYQPEEPTVEVSGIICPPVLSMEEFEREIEAQRQRMLWIQANREKVWAEMGISDGTPALGQEPLVRP